VFIEAKDDGGGGDNWTTGAISCEKLQLNHHNQQTNIQFLLWAGCPSCCPTNSVNALKGKVSHSMDLLTPSSPGVFQLGLWPLIAPDYLGEVCHASHQPSDASTPSSITLYVYVKTFMSCLRFTRGSPRSTWKMAVKWREIKFTDTNDDARSVCVHYLRWRLSPLMHQCWGLPHRLAQCMSLQGWGKLVNAALLSLINEACVNVCCATLHSSELVGPACVQARSSNLRGRACRPNGKGSGEEGILSDVVPVYLYCPDFSDSVFLHV